MYGQDRERHVESRPAVDTHRVDHCGSQGTRASRPAAREAPREALLSFLDAPRENGAAKTSGQDKTRERDMAGLRVAGEDKRGDTRRPSTGGSAAVQQVPGGGGNPSIRRPVAWRPSREDWLKKNAD